MSVHIFIVACHVEYATIEHTGVFNLGHFMSFNLIFFFFFIKEERRHKLS